MWIELVRILDEMDVMIFFRLFAVVERFWYKALWEDVENSFFRKVRMNKDWIMFVNILGYREFKVLDRMGVVYYLIFLGVR